MLSMPTILFTPLALVGLVNRPDYRLPKQGHVVLYGINDRVLTEASKEMGSFGSDVEMTEESDDSTSNLFTSTSSDWVGKKPSPDSINDWSKAVVDGIDRLCCDGGVRDPEGSRTLAAATQRDHVLVPPQRLRLRQELLLRSKRKTLRSYTESPSVQLRPKSRLVCEARRCLRWSPFGDHHLLTLTPNGSGIKMQPKSPTEGVCLNHHPVPRWAPSHRG